MTALAMIIGMVPMALDLVMWRTKCSARGRYGGLLSRRFDAALCSGIFQRSAGSRRHTAQPESTLSTNSSGSIMLHKPK